MPATLCCLQRAIRRRVPGDKDRHLGTPLIGGSCKIANHRTIRLLSTLVQCNEEFDRFAFQPPG